MQSGFVYNVIDKALHKVLHKRVFCFFLKHLKDWKCIQGSYKYYCHFRKGLKLLRSVWQFICEFSLGGIHMLHVGQKKQNLNHKRNILAYMRLASTASGCHRDKLYPLWCLLLYIQNSTSVILVPIYVLFEVWMVTQQGMLQLFPPCPQHCSWEKAACHTKHACTITTSLFPC